MNKKQELIDEIQRKEGGLEYWEDKQDESEVRIDQLRGEIEDLRVMLKSLKRAHIEPGTLIKCWDELRGEFKYDIFEEYCERKEPFGIICENNNWMNYELIPKGLIDPDVVK